MATNAKNLAELLNTDTTVAVGDIADGSVTTAKLASGAITTAKLADNSVTSAKSVNLGRRNILINGAFQHWQRGTSFSSNVYGSDRWKLYAPGSHAYSRSTDTPDFFEYSASVGGSGDATGLTQFVESRNAKHIPSSGSTKVILSFYLKHTTNSGANKITSVVGTLDSADNGGVSTNRSIKNHTTTNSWARYTHEMTGADLTAAVTNGLFITIKHNGSGTTAFLLTGCQFEINDSVTDFEHRSFAEELQLCKRYFQNIGGDGYSSAGFIYNDLPMFSFPFPVVMRVAPTGSVQGTGSAFSSTNATGQTNYTGSTTSNLNIYKSGNRNYLTGGSWSGSGNDRGNSLLGNQNVNFDAEI